MFLLAPLMFIALFPMEHPGSLVIWYGTAADRVFTTAILKFTLIDILLGMLLVLSFLFRKKSPPYKSYFGPIPTVLIVCAVTGFISTIVHGRGISLEQMGISGGKIPIYAAILYVCINQLIFSRDQFYRLFEAFLVSIFLLDLWGMYNYIFHGGIYSESLGRIVFWETAKLSYNVFAIAITITFMLIAFPKQLKLPKTFYYVLFVLALSIIALSSRRNPMVASFITIVLAMISAWFYGKRVRSMIPIVSLMIAVFALAVINYTYFEEVIIDKVVKRVESVGEVFSKKVDEKDTIKGHLHDLKLGVEIISRNPILGIGYNVANKNEINWVHNSLLTFWLRFGIVGAIVYFWLYWSILKTYVHSLRSQRDVLVLAFFLFFIAQLVQGLFFPPFFEYFKKMVTFIGPLALINAYFRTKSKSG